MSDTITYFGDPKRATYPDGKPIIVNGRPLLIPENFDLQNEINAAAYSATRPLGQWRCSRHTLRMVAAAIPNGKPVIQADLIRGTQTPATMDLG